MLEYNIISIRITHNKKPVAQEIRFYPMFVKTEIISLYNVYKNTRIFYIIVFYRGTYDESL